MEIIMTNYKQFYKEFFDESNMYVAVLSKLKTLELANKALLEFSGSKLEDILDVPYFELPWWVHSEELQNKLAFSMESAYFGETARFSTIYQNQTGAQHEIDFILKPITKDGETEFVLAMGYDITQLVSTQKSLTRREKEIDAFFENFSDGCFFYMLQDPISMNNLNCDHVDDIITRQKISGANSNLFEILGTTNINVNNNEILEILGIPKEAIQTLWCDMLKNGKSSIDTKMFNSVTNTSKNLNLTIVKIENDDNQFEGCFIVVRDVTQETKYIEQLSFLARKDPMTGLNNRRTFFEDVDKLFKTSKENNTAFSVAIMDIDHFKNVNDSYGHDIGDIVIKKFAEILQNNSVNSLTARYGGEEFVFASSLTMSEMEHVMNDIRIQTQNQQIDSPTGKISITVSGGFSASTDTTKTVEEIIINADKALYESKNNGRNRVTMFIEEIHGSQAYDKICNCLTEKSLKFRLNKFIYDWYEMNRYYSLLYIGIEYLNSEDLDTQNKDLSTLSLCIHKNIRTSDIFGRYGDLGLLVAFPDTTEYQVRERLNLIISFISVGFNHAINERLKIKYNIIDSKSAAESWDAAITMLLSNTNAL
jgi:diguanylate cyclase (GGDEF)-like protein/PAS domain S-box-containing protein